MSNKEKMQVPSGMAGLVRYYDEDKSIVKIKPEHVAVMCGMLIVIELVLFYTFKI